MSRFRVILFLIIFGMSFTATAGWEKLSKDELSNLVSDKTWEGRGFSVYWSSNGSRKLVAGDKTYIEKWTIKVEGDLGAILCAGEDSKVGERCGTVESRKGKYRSTRVSPKAGKRFKFKVKDGIPDF